MMRMFEDSILFTFPLPFLDDSCVFKVMRDKVKNRKKRKGYWTISNSLIISENLNCMSTDCIWLQRYN